MNLPKRIWSKTWNSEYYVDRDIDGFFLTPSENTNFNILSLSSFEKDKNGKMKKDLAWTSNFNYTDDDVEDIIEHNGILCYVFKNENNKYQLHPAIGGSGMAIDNYYMTIGSWGNYDFEKIECICGEEFYLNVEKIPTDEIYECVCPDCKMILKRKNKN